MNYFEINLKNKLLNLSNYYFMVLILLENNQYKRRVKNKGKGFNS